MALRILPWYKELETGIEVVDSQHMKFFKEANKFTIKYMAEKGSEAAMEELAFLQQYLCYHFQTEETFQFESDYPKYLDHQAEHKELVFQTKAMAVALETADETNYEERIRKFAEFINEWVTKHILNSDLEFSYYYKDYIESK